MSHEIDEAVQKRKRLFEKFDTLPVANIIGVVGPNGLEAGRAPPSRSGRYTYRWSPGESRGAKLERTLSS